MSRVLSLAGFQVTLIGRFWMIPEARARFELATLRLTADEVQNLNALSGVAYTNSEAILALLAAPNPAPNPAPNF